MGIRPLQDRVLVKRVKEEEMTKGGIIIPDTAKEKPIEGKVVAVGNGKVTENGNVRALEVKKGDRVLFGKYSGTEVKIDGEEHLILREDDILGVSVTEAEERDKTMAAKEILYDTSARDRILVGRQQPRQRRQGHARPQGPQRRHREELRRSHGHQGRRHRRQGDRAREQVREHGRADGARGRQQDLRHRR